jgi:hypothetical protein
MMDDVQRERCNEVAGVLAEYFGIHKAEITLPGDDDYYDEYLIFDREIEVVTVDTAISNELELSEGMDRYLHECITSKQIGMYTFLDHSGYMFRWL